MCLYRALGAGCWPDPCSLTKACNEHGGVLVHSEKLMGVRKGSHCIYTHVLHAAHLLRITWVGKCL